MKWNFKLNLKHKPLLVMGGSIIFKKILVKGVGQEKKML